MFIFSNFLMAIAHILEVILTIFLLVDTCPCPDQLGKPRPV